MGSRAARQDQRVGDRRAARLAFQAAERRAVAWRRRRNAAFAAVAGAALLIVLAIGETGGGTSAANGAGVRDAPLSSSLFAGIPQHGTLLGNPNAPVRLIEYADLQCPYCGEYATQALPHLVTRYVRTGVVSMDFRNLSFIGPDSVTAGRAAAAAAEQNRLWNFVDLEYLNQGVENTGYVTNAYLQRLFAAIPGLDAAAAEHASQGPAAAASLSAATANAYANGIDSTPSFLIGPANGPLRLFVPSSLTAAPFAAELNGLLRHSK